LVQLDLFLRISAADSARNPGSTHALDGARWQSSPAYTGCLNARTPLHCGGRYRRARGQTAAAPRRLLLLLLLLRLAPPPAPCCTALAANDDSLHRAAVDRTARNRRDFPLPARAIRGHQTVVIASSVPQ